MAEEKNLKFFITHSWRDNDFAQRLANDLRARGLGGFLDIYSVKAGDDIPREINRGLEECDVYIPVLSFESLKSKWCEREINAALMLSAEPGRNGRPHIIPVLAEDCRVALPPLLKPLLYINFAGQYPTALGELVRGINRFRQDHEVGAVVEPQTQRKVTPSVKRPSPQVPAAGLSAKGRPWQWILIVLISALVIVLCALGINFLVTRDMTTPVISRVEPPEDATLPYNPVPGSTLTRVNIKATYRDDRAVDVRSITLFVDGRDVIQQAAVSDTMTSFSADFETGKHVVLIDVYDTAGDKASRAWQFTIGNAPEPTTAPTETPTLTPIPQQTRLPSLTPTVSTIRPPTVTLFTANPATIARGASSLLQWNVANADQVFLNQEKVDPASSRLVSPTSTTTYYLIAYNAGGTTTMSVIVTVQDLPDLTVTDISLTTGNQIIYTVRNIGGGDVTRSFLIQVIIGSVVVESDRPISALPSQQEARLVVPNYTLLGTQSISVNVNLLQEVQESNYNNNMLVRSLVGPTPTPGKP